MPQATWFVKTDGDDGNDGTSWADAKATIQAGINLVDDTGQIVAVAPGVYNEGVVTGSAQAGASDAWNELVFDTLGEYTDGDSNTHGLTGWAVLFSDDTGAQLDWASSAEYWRFRKIVIHTWVQNTGAFLFSGVPDEVEFYDCIGITNRRGFFLNFGGSFSGNENVKMYRCYGRGMDRGGITLYSTSSSQPASAATLNSCIGVTYGQDNQDRGGIAIGGAVTNTKVTATLNNCSGWAHANSGLTGSGINGDAGNGKGFLTRCFGGGYQGILVNVAGSTFTNCYAQSSNNSAGVTNIPDTPVSLHSVPRLYPFSVIADGLVSDYSGSLSGEYLYDVFGNLLVDTIGAEQYISVANEIHEFGYPGYNPDSSRGLFYLNTYKSDEEVGGSGNTELIIGGKGS